MDVTIPGPIDDMIYEKPCVVFHDVGPEQLAEIRAAAQPRPPTVRIEVHPYYLQGLDPETEEARHAARLQLQGYLDDAIRAHVNARAFSAGVALQEVYRNVDTT